MKFEFIDKKQGTIKDDILSGLTVSLALVPEAVAFAFIIASIASPILNTPFFWTEKEYLKWQLSC